MNQLVSRSNIFDDFFKDFAPGFYVRPLHGDGLPPPGQIRIDVKEDDKAYIVQAEIPGVRKDDIQVSLDQNVVTLRAEIKQEDSKSNGGKLLRSERYYGAMERSFQLPMEFDQAKSKAHYGDGVLMLTLPKKAGSGSRQLRIE